MGMNRIPLRAIGIISLALPLAAILLFVLATPAFAISPPDSTPTIEQINAYRNVLETGDFLVIIYENTPYASTPGTNYSEAFIWRLIDTDGETELAQALGSNYNDRGYGYNVIAFYFSEEDAPSGYWEQPYNITLSGTLAAFDNPPKYTFSMVASDYSALTETAAVKAEISQRILEMAADLDNRWGLDTDYSLLSETETATTLSIYGQAFFRQAIYGLQAMAPDAFPFSVTNVDVDPRSWNTTYVTDLETQYTGTYLEPAIEAGEGFFNVDYNLMGMLLILMLCVSIIFGNWYLAGGTLWKGMAESVSPLVIGARMGLFGLGELGLIAALCWLYISAKLWKVV